VGEESDHSGPHSESDSDSEQGQNEIDDQIVQERRFQALQNVPAVKMDSWLQYTKWHEILS
jgi:hypothetical protein